MNIQDVQRIADELVIIDDHNYALMDIHAEIKGKPNPNFEKWYAHAEFNNVDIGPYDTAALALAALGVTMRQDGV